MARKQAGNINVDYTAQTAGLRKAEGDVRRSANSMERNFRRARNETRSLTRGIRDLTGRLRGLSAFGSVLAGGFLAGWSRDILESSAGMVELSIRTGETTTALEHLIRATEADGASRDKAARSIANWSRVVTEAADGSAEYADTFRALGLDARRLSLLPLTDQFREVAEAVSTATEEGRRFQALGLLTQLVGARNVQGFTAFFERGRFERNLAEGAALPVATREELDTNKELFQDFTNLSNVIKTSLIRGLSDASGGLSRLAEAAQRNIPAAIGAVSGQGRELLQSGALLAGGATLLLISRSLHTFLESLRTFSTFMATRGLFSYALSSLARASLIFAGATLFIDQLYDLYRRFQLLVGIEPIDIEGLGRTPETQHTAARTGLARAQYRVAEVERELERLRTDPVYRFDLERTGQHVPTDLDLAEAQVELERWRDAWRRVSEANTRLADASEGAAGTAVVASDRLAGLITDIGEVFRALEPLPEFVNPRFDIARHLEGTIRDARQVGTLDLRGLSLRPAGMEPTPTPFHVLGSARELEAEFRVHEEILSNVAIAAGDALGDFVDAITDSTQGFRDAMASFLRSLSRAITSGVGAGLTDRLLSGLGLRAGGGYASGLTLVGERGPELLDFRNPAMVYSNAQLGAAIRGGGGAGGVTVNFSPTINAVDAVGVEGVLIRQRKALVEAVSAELLHRSGYSNPLTQRFDAPGF